MAHHLRQVNKTVTCNRCGCGGLGWVQSAAGRWYLCEVLVNHITGIMYAEVFKAHKCPTVQPITTEQSPMNRTREQWLAHFTAKGYAADKISEMMEFID